MKNQNYDNFLYELDSQIRWLKDELEGKLGWVKSDTENVERKLKMKPEDMNLNSLGEFQATAVAVDVVIGKLTKIIEMRKTFLRIFQEKKK